MSNRLPDFPPEGWQKYRRTCTYCKTYHLTLHGTAYCSPVARAVNTRYILSWLHPWSVTHADVFPVKSFVFDGGQCKWRRAATSPITLRSVNNKANHSHVPVEGRSVRSILVSAVLDTVLIVGIHPQRRGGAGRLVEGGRCHPSTKP